MTYTDNFNYTENPISHGGLWDTPNNWNNMRTNGSQAYVATSGADCAAIYVGGSFNNEHYTQFDCPDIGAAFSGPQPVVRVQGTGDGSGYACFYLPNAEEFTFYDVEDSGGSLGWTQVGSPISASYQGDFQDGDNLRLEATPTSTTTLELFINDNSQGSVQDTSSPYQDGYPGISAYDSGGGVLLDNWEGGDIGGGGDPNIGKTVPLYPVFLPWSGLLTLIMRGLMLIREIIMRRRRAMRWQSTLMT